MSWSCLAAGMMLASGGWPAAIAAAVIIGIVGTYLTARLALRAWKFRKKDRAYSETIAAVYHLAMFYADTPLDLSVMTEEQWKAKEEEWKARERELVGRAGSLCHMDLAMSDDAHAESDAYWKARQRHADEFNARPNGERTKEALCSFVPVERKRAYDFLERLQVLAARDLAGSSLSLLWRGLMMTTTEEQDTEGKG